MSPAGGAHSPSRSILTLRRAVAIRLGPALLCLAWIVPSSSAAAEERVFAFAIERGRVAAGGDVVKVRQGDKVTLRWTSDASAILHLHGYKLETTVAPGRAAELIVDARAAGRFPIHLHRPGEPSSRSHHHDPPLVTLEVHPR